MRGDRTRISWAPGSDNKLATVPGEASGVELISGPRLAGSPGEGRRSRSRAAIFRVGRRQRGLRGRLRPRLDVRGQRGARHLGHGGGGPGAARLNTSGFASMSSVLCAPAGAAAPTCSTRKAAPQSCKRSSSTRPTSSPLHDNSPPPPQADGAAARPAPPVGQGGFATTNGISRPRSRAVHRRRGTLTVPGAAGLRCCHPDLTTTRPDSAPMRPAPRPSGRSHRRRTDADGPVARHAVRTPHATDHRVMSGSDYRSARAQVRA